MSDKGKEPGADANLNDVVKYLLSVDPATAEQWVRDNESRYTPEELDQISTNLAGQPTNTADYNRVGEALIEVRSARDAVSVAERQSLADKAAAQIVGAQNAGTTPTADTNSDGKVSADEQAAWDAGKKKAAEQVKQQALDQGLTPAQADQAAANATNDSLFGVGVKQPDWIKNLYGAQLTDRQVQELMDSYNEAHPNDRVGTADQLFAKLQSPANPDNKELVEATIGGRDPVVTQSWNVFDQHGASRSVRMSADQVNAAMTAFGADLTSLGKIVRLASRSGLIDSEGNVEWQILAGLAKATGRVKPQEKPTDFMTSGISKDTRTFPGLQTDIIDGGNMSILAAKYREGLDRYGDPALAYLHALNPALAQQLSVTKGDKLTREQKVAATTLFEKGGISGQLLSDLGFARANSFNQTANALLDAGYYENGSPGGNGTPGNQVTTRDPAAVRQKAKETWQTMFFTDPTEQQLQGFISQMDAAYQAQSASTTDITQGVELDARLQAYAESQPIYKELYGNKPKGMSDADYRVQFQAGAQGLLGNETADPNTLKSGMRTGQYQTTVGAVAGSAKAFGNSTFLGRLAQAAQVVNAST